MDDILVAWKKNILAVKVEPCRPPSWLRGGHRQTMLGNLILSPRIREKGQPHLISLSDGDRLAATLYRGAAESAVLYLFHGLGGSSGSGYIRRMVHVGLRNGYHVLCVNHRGCGLGRGLAAGPYHSGRAEDLSAAIEFGRGLYPGLQHLAVGFSLSGNALLLLQARFRGAVQPDFGIAVNAPINLGRGAVLLHQGLNRIYDLRFAVKCRKSVHERYHDGLIPTRYRFPFRQTLHDFDQTYTAPEGGFEDRDDYYRTCSSKDHLPRISAPTVILTSQDDPMVDFRDYRDARFSEKVVFRPERFGGHLGYLMFNDRSIRVRRWMDEALDAYLLAWMRTVAPKNSG